MQGSISSEDLPSFICLAGRLIVSARPATTGSSYVTIHHPSKGDHKLECVSTKLDGASHITVMTIDHSEGLSIHSSRLAVFLSTGEFSVFALSHHDLSASSRLIRFVPRVHTSRNTPIVRAAYHHPLLVTLSASFRLTIYDLSHGKARAMETLSSFTSYLPASMSLSAVSSSSQAISTYKLLLAYSVTVYPEHWSVAATEVAISATTFGVQSTRTARACEIPFGFISTETERVMRDQWARRVKHASDVALDPDGRWIVLGPGADAGTAPNALQLYRLSFRSGSATGTDTQPKLIFVRHLHGLSGPVSCLAIAGGRCVCVGANGSMRVWDLEHGAGAEIREADAKQWEGGGVANRQGAVVLDDRKVVSISQEGVQVRRFDI